MSPDEFDIELTLEDVPEIALNFVSSPADVMLMTVASVGPPGADGVDGAPGPPGSGILPGDVVIAANQFVIRNRLASGNTQPAFRLMGDGKIEWGPGGSVAPDTMLWRQAVELLHTNSFIVSDQGYGINAVDANSLSFATWYGGLANDRFEIYADGKMYWGPGTAAPDVNFYRERANVLRTDNWFWTMQGLGTDGGLYAGSDSLTESALQIYLNTDIQNRLSILQDGKMRWGAGGTTPPDVNLYRDSADWLVTDDSFWAKAGIYTANYIEAGTLLAARPTLAQVALAIYKTGDPADRFDILTEGILRWGDGVTAPTLKLYRYGANAMAFESGLAIRHDWGIWTEGVTAFANAFAAYALGTDAQPTIKINGQGKIEWGPGGATLPDTNLYRGALNQLRTDDDLVIGGNATVVGGTLAIGADVAVYRGAANVLKTDDSVEIVGTLTVGGVPITGSGSAPVASAVPSTATGDVAATNVQDAIAELASEKQAISAKGAVNGYASLDSGGKVPSAQLPSTTPTALVPATSLPGSPVNGQQAILTDSLSAPTYQWLCQYDTSISDAYKWRVIGGEAMDATTATVIGQGGGSGQSDVSGGPNLTIPRSGIYIIEYSAIAITSGTSGQGAVVFLVVNGGTVSRAGGGTGSGYWNGSTIYRATFAAGDALKHQYANDLSGGITTLYDRHILARPIRLS